MRDNDTEADRPLRDIPEGSSVWDQDEATNWVDEMTALDLIADAGIEPFVSTAQAAEYFDRSNQWIYWGLKPDPHTGEIRFVWDDGSPISPERIGGSDLGRRRFTMPILRGIVKACHRRGTLNQQDLMRTLKRIRYTEIGVEWREKEGWRYVHLGRNRHRWVKPEYAYFDFKTNTWKLKKGVTL